MGLLDWLMEYKVFKNLFKNESLTEKEKWETMIFINDQIQKEEVVKHNEIKHRKNKN